MKICRKFNVRTAIKVMFFLTVLTVITCCNNIDQSDPTCDFPLAFEKAGKIINHTECKSNGGIINEVISSSNEYISFNYFNNYKIVQLSHINTGMNCCPEKISAVIIFVNDTIKIIEKEAKAGCKCNCLYDINYELRNINPGIYHVEIFGPITDGLNIPQFSCVINIPDDTDSLFFNKRGFYPWQE